MIFAERLLSLTNIEIFNSLNCNDRNGKGLKEIIEKYPEGEEGRTFGSLVYEEEMYSIGIPTVLYKELLLIAEGKEENLMEKLLEKISSKETYLLDIVPDEALLWMV